MALDDHGKQIIRVVDKHGHTEDGGFVLTKESYKALELLLLSRGNGGILMHRDHYKDELGRVIRETQGLEFPEWT